MLSDIKGLTVRGSYETKWCAVDIHSSQQSLAWKHDGMCRNSARGVKTTLSLCFKLKIIWCYSCVCLYLMKKSRFIFFLTFILLHFQAPFLHAVTLLWLKCISEGLISRQHQATCGNWYLLAEGWQETQRRFSSPWGLSPALIQENWEEKLLNFESFTWTGPAACGFNTEAQEEFIFLFSYRTRLMLEDWKGIKIP